VQNRNEAKVQKGHDDKLEVTASAILRQPCTDGSGREVHRPPLPLGPPGPPLPLPLPRPRGARPPRAPAAAPASLKKDERDISGLAQQKKKNKKYALLFSLTRRIVNKEHVQADKKVKKNDKDAHNELEKGLTRQHNANLSVSGRM
jgi:hypothetical protein